MASPSQNPYQTQELAKIYSNLATYAQTRMTEFEKLSGSDYARAMQEVRNVVADAYGKYGESGTLNYTEMQRYTRIVKLKQDVEYAIRTNLKGVATKAQKVLAETAQYSYNGSANVAKQFTGTALTRLTAREVSYIINKSPGIGPGMSYDDRMLLRQSDAVVRMNNDIMRQLMKQNGAPLEDTWAAIQTSMEKTYLRDMTALKDEAHHVSQSAIDQSMIAGRTKGLKPVKIWMTAGDEKVRPAHRALDGQVRDANDVFTIGEDTTFKSEGVTEWDGYQARAPMEFGEPALDYNCRCWIVADWREADENDDPEDIEATDNMYKEAETRHLIAKEYADEAMNTFGKIVEDYGGTIDGDYKLTQYRVKIESSIAEKIARKLYLADEQANQLSVEPNRATIKDAANNITDYVRFTGEFPAEIYTEGFYMTQDALYKLGWNQVEVDNRWVPNKSSPNDTYHGINTLWQMPDGKYVEIQFHTPEGSNYMQSEGHKLYEASRVTTDPLEKWQLEQQMIENWKRIEMPSGVDTIENYREGY